MTSEKDLRQSAANFIRVCRDGLADGIIGENLPDSDDPRRVADMIRTWPIPELPPADRDGCWWPKHGRNYGHVKNGTVWHPDKQFPGPGVIIARGGPGESSKHTRMYLTPDEAEELASLLLAAAHHERNQK